MLFFYVILLIFFHFACGEWYYGSSDNVGRLTSQRKFAHSDVPYCERPVSERSKLCTRRTIACKTNLKGYYIGECRWYISYEDAEYKECPAGTRCGCIPNGECPPELRSNPCIPVDKPYAMEERATFTFSGTLAKEWTGLAYPLEYTEENYHVTSPPTTSKVVGMVKQDVKEGKFLQVITKQYVKDHFTRGVKSFTLIIPNNGDNTYTKYMGYLPDRKCKRTILKKFEPFGMDIKNFLLTDSTPQKDGTILQTWEYKSNVEWMSVANFHWKWIVESDVTRKSSRPLMSSYFDDMAYDDDDWQFAKVQNIDWKTQDFDVDWISDVKWYSDLLKDKGDWFSIPSFCQ